MDVELRWKFESLKNSFIDHQNRRKFLTKKLKKNKKALLFIHQKFFLFTTLLTA